jgi:hypothetical protein
MFTFIFIILNKMNSIKKRFALGVPQRETNLPADRQSKQEQKIFTPLIYKVNFSGQFCA